MKLVNNQKLNNKLLAQENKYTLLENNKNVLETFFI